MVAKMFELERQLLLRQLFDMNRDLRGKEKRREEEQEGESY